MNWSDRALPELQEERDWFDQSRAREYRRFERASVIIRRARYTMPSWEARSILPKVISWMG